MTELDAHPPHFHALAPMQGVLHALEASRGTPSPEFLRELAKNVRSALDQLLAPDPLRERMEFVLLAIRTSTRVKKVVGINMVETTRVQIRDLELYNWAMEQVHSLIHLQNGQNGNGQEAWAD